MKRVVAAVVLALVAGGVGYGVRRALTHGDDESPRGDAPAKLLLAQIDTEAPTPTQMTLPTARAAQDIRKPHPRLELGTTEIRLFGDRVGAMPPVGATALANNVLTGPATWGRDVVADAGRGTSTLEIAVDGSVRFGVVLDAMLQLARAEWRPTLLLVTDESRALKVLPLTTRIPSMTIVVDSQGARVDAGDAGGSCTWTRGARTDSFAACIAKTLAPSTRDAGHDGSEDDAGLGDVARLLQASVLGASPMVLVTPTRDARWEDVIATIDASAEMSLDVGLGMMGSEP